MSVVDQVSAYLQSCPGKRLCVHCIQAGANIPNYPIAYEATCKLSGDGASPRYVRVEGICDACGEPRFITQEERRKPRSVPRK
jgi:hypothetical protein